jgi:hypothetical protein
MHERTCLPVRSAGGGSGDQSDRRGEGNGRARKRLPSQVDPFGKFRNSSVNRHWRPKWLKHVTDCWILRYNPVDRSRVGWLPGRRVLIELARRALLQSEAQVLFGTVNWIALGAKHPNFF